MRLLPFAFIAAVSACASAPYEPEHPFESLRDSRGRFLGQIDPGKFEPTPGYRWSLVPSLVPYEMMACGSRAIVSSIS